MAAPAHGQVAEPGSRTDVSGLAVLIFFALVGLAGAGIAVALSWVDRVGL